MYFQLMGLKKIFFCLTLLTLLSACSQSGDVGAEKKKIDSPTVDIGTLPVTYEYTVLENTKLVDNLSKISSDLKVKKFEVMLPPQNGTWTNLDSKGNFSYLPPKNFNGLKSFWIKVTTHDNSQVDIEGTIKVIAVNSAPELSSPQSSLSLVTGEIKTIALTTSDEDSSVFNYSLLAPSALSIPLAN